MSENKTQLFFSPAEVAMRWGWHPESVRRKVRRGEIAATKIGGRVLVPIAELERIEKEGRNKRALVASSALSDNAWPPHTR